MKYLILAILSLLLFSCGNGGNENSGKQDEGIGGVLSSEYGQLKIKSEDCGLNYDDKMREISIYFTTYYPTRVATTLENEKYISCRTNIQALTCESEAIINFDLSTVPDCLFYENTKGFPDWKGECERFMTGVCEVPRNCVNGVQCNHYQGEKPFREGCAEAENNQGDHYTCEDLYDINYDISTITECQFIFTE